MPPTLPLLVLLLLLLLPAPARTALTHNGLPSGQTLAPPALSLLQPPTCHPQSAFHTLHDHPCASARVANVRTAVSSNLTRVVSAANLSEIIARAAASGPTPIVVLFHGGPSCEWSRAIFPLWLRVAKRYRTMCFLAIDAKKDYVLNYNLMVLGFPTIMRVWAEKPNETFRRNRTEAELVAWVEKVTGVSPMEMDVQDEDWLGEPQGTVEMSYTEEVNWTLVAANVVTAVNALGVLWWALNGIRGRWKTEIERPHAD